MQTEFLNSLSVTTPMPSRWQFILGVGSLVDLMFCLISFWCPRVVWAFFVQCSFAFSSVRLGNPVNHPFSIALRKVACVGDPRAKWCMFTCWAMVLVLLPRPPVVFTSLVVIAIGLLAGLPLEVGLYSAYHQVVPYRDRWLGPIFPQELESRLYWFQ